MARKIEVQIVGDSKSLERAFNRSASAGRKFSVGIGSIAKGAAVFGLITGAATLAGKAIGTAVDEWKDSVKVAAQTNAVIKSTGGTANISAKGVSNLAGQIQQLSGLDDEAIQSGENLLLTFKNVKNEIGKGNNVFDRATKAAVDLSVAGFGSITSTSKQLGKALNDPIKGMSALSRSGVTFSASQQKTIKGLVASGKLLQAQKIILREVESQVGGSAKAYGDTLPGGLSKLRESVKNTFGGLVAKVAPPLAKGLQSVNSFVAGISKAHGVRAKFNVAFDGLKDLGGRIFREARAAVSHVDWNEVVKTAQDGLVSALRGIARALDRVNWGEVGRRLGQAIATGMKGAKQFLQGVNWQDVGQTIVRGIANFIKHVNWIAVATNLIKLLVAAVKGVVSLALGIGKELGGQIMAGIGQGVKAGTDFILKKLLEFVNKVLGITGFLGRFDPFKGVRAKVQKQLAGMEGDTRSAVTAMNSSLDGIKDVDVTITINTVATFDGKKRPEEGTGALSVAQGQARKAISDDKARRGAAATRAAAKARQRTAAATAAAGVAAGKAQAAAAKRAAAAAKKAADARDKAFAGLMDSLSLKFDRAEAAHNFRQAASVLNDEEKAVRAQIAATGRTTELERQLFQIEQARTSLQQDRRDAAKKAAQKAAAKAQSRQFKLLGLTGQGQEVVPGAENLRKQLAAISERIADAPGQVPAKLANRLAGVKKLLSKSFKGLTEESRGAIRDLFTAIRQEFANQDAKGPITKTTSLNSKKVLAGLNISADLKNELRGRLSAFNSAGIALANKRPATGAFGGGPVVVESHTTVNLDGKPIARSVTRNQQKRARRNPPQRRGPNRNI